VFKELLQFTTTTDIHVVSFFTQHSLFSKPRLFLKSSQFTQSRV